MKFISSAILLVALQMFSAKKSFYGGCHIPLCAFPNQNNVANINNVANSNANALAVQAGCYGNANANAISAATNVNHVNQGGFC
jgi:hypothetical protein